MHEDTLCSIGNSAKALANRLKEGSSYGVNGPHCSTPHLAESDTCQLVVTTGFGGSADTRTRRVYELQRNLIRELHSGVLQAPARFRPWHETTHRHDGDTGSDFNKRIRDVNPQASSDTSKNLVSHNDCTVADHDGTNKRLEDVALLLENALPADDPNTCMPESWTRASILIRINSLASAYSGVRPILITAMMDLLKHNIIPRIPLRGSILAFGDLMPLSYVGGTLLGKPTLTVSAIDSNIGARRVTTADVALAESSL